MYVSRHMVEYKHRYSDILSIGIDLEVLAQVAASELVFSVATQCTSAPFFRRMYFEVARMQGRLSLGSGISAVLVA
ncbi:hypothetical protein Plhal304r1_c068g0156071 [Plasmopara halstedii]